MIPRRDIDPRQVRRVILRQSKRANVGHIGSCLCVVEILSALYSAVLRIPSPDHPDRDRFILSKGHAGLALYAVLAEAGLLPEELLDTFCGGASRLGVHPETRTPGADFATGSLGQGLSIATGAALAAKMQRSDRRVFCLVSDAEFNEGSVWEAAQFASHHSLANLTVIADMNGQQAFGTTQQVLAGNARARWEAFGWHAADLDGHSLTALKTALTAPASTAPRMFLARTTFGKGVSFMERGEAVTQLHLPVNPVNWHYLPLSDEEFAQAMSEVDAA